MKAATQIISSAKGRRIQFLAIGVIVLSGTMAYLYSHRQSQSDNVNGQTIPLTISAQLKAHTTPIEKLLPWHSVQIASGDSLATIFNAGGVSAQTLLKVMQLPLAKHYLTNLQIGHALKFHRQTHGVALSYALDAMRTLQITPSVNGYQARIQTTPLKSAPQFVHGNVGNSFHQSAINAGMSNAMIAQMAHVLGYKVNFSQAVRRGDHFSALYEGYYLKGKKIKNGPLLAMTFSNHGHTYSAIRFKNKNGQVHYYDQAGYSLMPAFLRAPLHYVRISSRFSYHRMDPILHKIRPHLGVDYAAPEGTPVRAMGDGVVKFDGHKGGYGNAVIIQYGRHYRSLYGHMLHFARKLHAGERVTRGEVVGYVGDTGWSTGPHLHFSLYVNGVPKNPLTLKLPHAYRVPLAQRKRFFADEKRLFAQLDA